MRSLIFGTVLTACGTLTSAALAETREFDVPGFTGLHLGTGVEATVTVGGEQSVSIEERDGDFEKLVVEVRRGALYIKRKKRLGLFNSSPDYRATISVPHLDDIDLSTGSEADITGVEADDLNIDLSTGADGTISGSCGRLDLDLSTGAELDAEELICATVMADLSTGSDASVTATDVLDADVSLGAHLSVYGDPEIVKTDTALGGDVDIK